MGSNGEQNKTYQATNFSKQEILSNHKSVLSSHGILSSDKDNSALEKLHCLPADGAKTYPMQLTKYYRYIMPRLSRNERHSSQRDVISTRQCTSSHGACQHGLHVFPDRER